MTILEHEHKFVLTSIKLGDIFAYMEKARPSGIAEKPSSGVLTEIKKDYARIGVKEYRRQKSGKSEFKDNIFLSEIINRIDDQFRQGHIKSGVFQELGRRYTLIRTIETVSKIGPRSDEVFKGKGQK